MSVCIWRASDNQPENKLDVGMCMAALDNQPENKLDAGMCMMGFRQSAREQTRCRYVYGGLQTISQRTNVLT